MSHTYASLHTHIVFSTKNRAPLITPDLEPVLFSYINGIACRSGCAVLRAGGTSDHVHLLLRLATNVSVATMVNKIKANSSRWIRQKEGISSSFGWQTGYGAFAVGLEETRRVERYIRRQKEHHRGWSFEDEMRRLLRAYGFDVADRSGPPRADARG